MVRMKLLALWFAGLAATSSPAGAQCRLCDQPATERATDSADGDVQLQIEASLNFDRLIVSGAGGGAVTIRPDGSNSTEGAVSDVGSRAMVGTVQVHGTAGRALRVDLPHRIELYSTAGRRITLDEVVTDLPSAPHLDTAGNLRFRFGGRLVVAGDADGQYRGDLPITVEYL